VAILLTKMSALRKTYMVEKGKNKVQRSQFVSVNATVSAKAMIDQIAKHTGKKVFAIVEDSVKAYYEKTFGKAPS